ncbi:MAG: hypothetical protein ACR2G2_03005 [Pseudonocardia sp.]
MRENRVLFCQREAAETAVYLTEVAPRTGDVWIRNDLSSSNAEYNDALNRVAVFADSTPPWPRTA